MDGTEGVRWHDTTQFLCAWPFARTVEELWSISRWLKDAQNMFALDAHFVYMVAEQWLGRGASPVTRRNAMPALELDSLFNNSFVCMIEKDTIVFVCGDRPQVQHVFF